MTSDPTRIRQILINLIGNAIKFTNAGSIVAGVCFEERSDACGGPALQFSVVDSGIGMTEEQLAKVFSPFSQADASTTREFGGTGLGLTISRKLVELLGGTFEVESEKGTGSVFRVTLPTGSVEGVRRFTEPPENLGAERLPNVALTNVSIDATVLVAEDNVVNRKLLSKAGMRTTFAENGEKAVDLALSAAKAGRPFDVILMDMQMPILDGYDATAELCQRGYKRPIIALTANAMSSDREKCLQVGCDDYATKPIDRGALLEKIAEAVRAREPRRVRSSLTASAALFR